MKKKLFYITYLFCILVFFSCEKKDKEPELGSLYGIVTDKTTGNPLRNAGVELMPIGLKAQTGLDGNFEFTKVEEGTYHLYVTKSGYKELKTNTISVKGNSNNKPVNILLEKLPPALTIVDDKHKEIDSLDFGADDGVVMLSFNIFNNSEEKLKWSISYQCNWIKSFSEEKGDLEANQTQSLVITIDRSKLNVGENSTIVHITSNNGSKQLTITATSLSIVETKDVSDIGGQAASLNANIIRDMDPSISEYGFVYSTSPAPSLANGAKKISQKGTPRIGAYSMLAEGLTHNTKYYVRAFVANTQETIYGGQVDFTTSLPHAPVIKLTNTLPSPTSNSITFTYEVTSDGGLPLEEVGVCWAIHSAVAIDDNHMTTGNEVKKYTTTITKLTPSTEYYIRAYARNADCTEYSTEFTKTTLDGRPQVVTYQSNYSAGTDYLIITGEATSGADYPIIEQGICYSTIAQEPTINDNFVLAISNSSPFSCKIEGLNSGTKYRCRAFARNSVDIAYGKTYEFSTEYEPTTLTGYVYDQDGNPISGAEVSGYDVSGYSATTDNNGYYSITLGSRMFGKYQFSASASNYNYQIKEVTVVRGQETQQNFYLTIATPFSVDLGLGTYVPTGRYWQMLFSCSQSSLAGTTVTKNMRIKNHKSVSVPYSITNLPTTGITFVPNSGTITANGEVSITIRFTYPSTTSQLVSLNGCSTGTKTYVWNWEGVLAGYFADQNGAPYESACSALCYQTPVITVGNQSEAFDLIFNQYVTYR